MVQAFEANLGDGVPENESANAHDQSLIGEVIDFVKEHKALSTIAGIGAAAGAIYLARAPIGRMLSGLGGSIFVADDAAAIAAQLGKSPVGRQLAVAGEEVAAIGAKTESVVAGGLKSEGAIAAAAKGEDVIVAAGAADDAIVSGVKATEATNGSGRPLLDALDDAVRTGKAKSPEPWVYHPENRGILKDLPKGGSGEIKSAEGGLDAATTAHSTNSPEVAEIARLAFPGITKTPIIDVNKHRFLRGK
jgi:hypothetical protein